MADATEIDESPCAQEYATAGPLGFLPAGWRTWLLPAGVLVLMTLVAYAPAMHAGWIWDDEGYIFGNAQVTHPGHFLSIWKVTGTSRSFYYPLTESVFWLEWRLWGPNPAGYHVVNILLHALAAILLWRVLGKLAVPGAYLAAAVFALHPVAVASVAWATELKNVLSINFYLLAILAWLRWGESKGRSWYLASLGLFLLALLSKTSVVVLPLVLLLCTWWRQRKLGLKDVLHALPFFALAAAMGLVTIWVETHRSIGSMVVRPEGFLSRIAAAGWIAWFYLYKCLLPVHLSMVYPRWNVDGASLVSFAPLLLLLACLATLWVFRKGWSRGPLMGLGYFVLALLPVLGFTNIAFFMFSLVSDHFQYLAMIGIVALVCAGAAVLANRLTQSHTLKMAAAGILLAVLGTLTWGQAATYRDRVTFWSHTVEENPRAWIAINNLGLALFSQGQTQAAIEQYRQAIGIYPNYPATYDDLGNALCKDGKVAEGIAQYRYAIRLCPDFWTAYYDLGTALCRQGKTQEGIEQLRQALRLNLDPGVAYNLGNALCSLGKLDEGIEQFRLSVRLNPTNAQTHNNLGNALCRRGKMEEGIEQYREAIRLDPGYEQACNNLAAALMKMGRIEEASKVPFQDWSSRQNRGR